MTQLSDLEFFLKLDDEAVPLAGHMTLGRHLDNDVLLAGEDVLDYHVRLELTPRGPRAIPLGEASLRVNGQNHSESVGLMPGDRIEIGQSVLELDAAVLHPAEADEWRLCSAGDADGWAVHGDNWVGRGEDSDLQLLDDHVSRRHARLLNHLGVVWIQDAGSANGTFINGQRLAGAGRLFQGDEIRFDSLSWQLVGRGGELTPVRASSGEAERVPLSPTLRDDRDRAADTTEFAAVEEAPTDLPELPETDQTGAFLLGASEPVAGLMFRTPIGRTLLGRDDDCDLVIRDRTVSARHAELTVRAQGVTITDLMATNGTRVNGVAVQSARLHDGDVLRIGRVSLVFKDIPVAAQGRPWLRYTQLALLAASLLLALGLIAYLL